MVAGTLAYIALMVLLVRPILRQVIARWEMERLPRSAVALVFVALLLSALTTESIGIHAIFGAFLLGAVIPHDSTVARTFTRQLESVVTVLLLPTFFAFTGLRTRIDLVTGLDQVVHLRADHPGGHGGEIRWDLGGGPTHRPGLA